MKILVILTTICFTSILFSIDSHYKSGENSGQGKVERLDRSEKYLEEVSKKMTNLENEVKSLKSELNDLKLRFDEGPNGQARKNPSASEAEAKP